MGGNQSNEKTSNPGCQSGNKINVVNIIQPGDPKTRRLNLLENTYIFEIIKGLSVTIRHFIKNIFNIKGLPTITYPETRRPLPENYRGRHRLTKREDGTPRCVACFLCATACPADCIHIEAAEYENNPHEKYPARYDIDILRCVFCGLCVEACPCDAIRMDTGKYDLCDYTRKSLIYDKEFLMKDIEKND
ncbi:MAG: NADH-quinone oxidoreductase subunit I [Candidatus Wallbacteria bacterium]